MLCAELQKRFPVRFTTEAHLPLFRHTDGKMLAREEVGGIAKLAAIAVGNGPKETDSHSFRSAGASALMNAKVEYPVVQRFGRWSTDAAHGYIWEAFEKQRDLARLMADQDYEIIHATKLTRVPTLAETKPKGHDEVDLEGTVDAVVGTKEGTDRSGFSPGNDSRAGSATSNVIDLMRRLHAKARAVTVVAFEQGTGSRAGGRGDDWKQGHSDNDSWRSKDSKTRGDDWWSTTW